MKKYKYSYHRRPKTSNEKRQNQNCEYVRAKRRSHNIPSSWDDITLNHEKSWKSKRKKQYREITRGKKHTHYIDLESGGKCYGISWVLRKHFEEHEIPHVIDHIKETYAYKSYDGNVYKGSRNSGIKITWWSNKDIGLKYILKKTALSFSTRNF